MISDIIKIIWYILINSGLCFIFGLLHDDLICGISFMTLSTIIFTCAIFEIISDIIKRSIGYYKFCR